MDKLKIAIMGATSHIAKGLLYNLNSVRETELYPFTTSPKKLAKFILDHDLNCQVYEGYSGINLNRYDMIINCVGMGATNSPRFDKRNYFSVLEQFDNMAISYVSMYPDCTYVCLASGAIYGRLSTPANDTTTNSILVNHVTKEEHFSISRLYSEVKHRAHADLNIVDLRIFSYFSRFADLSENYFMNQVIAHILQKKELIVTGGNFIRDYLHPQDLLDAILLTKRMARNQAMDICSRKPVSKIEILDYMGTVYGLRYKVDDSIGCNSASGVKPVYYSEDTTAQRCIGYSARYTSMETIITETKQILVGIQCDLIS
jgi:nucleoside-diphosphate-sugar epimerase